MEIQSGSGGVVVNENRIDDGVQRDFLRVITGKEDMDVIGARFGERMSDSAQNLRERAIAMIQDMVSTVCKY